MAYVPQGLKPNEERNLSRSSLLRAQGVQSNNRSTSQNMTTTKSMSLGRALGVAVKRLRNEKGMTQEALAHAAEVSLVTLARIESAGHNSKLETIAQLAGALGISAAELVAECERVFAREAKRR
jgi:DNA-binding XRE family transcriptional regulator